MFTNLKSGNLLNNYVNYKTNMPQHLLFGS